MLRERCFMKNHRSRNWSHYNQHLKRQARIELYLSEDLFSNWYYTGPRKAGGVQRYSDGLIEACLLVREYFGLALRQTQGFMESLMSRFTEALTLPDYTTLCRRASRLNVRLQPQLPKLRTGGYIIAVDSTGLSVIARDSWNRHKHGKRHSRHSQTWRKLHLSMEVESGEIIECDYSSARTNDCLLLPSLIAPIVDDQLQAVCADMAYDTKECRGAIHDKKATQLIPPKRHANFSRLNPKTKAYGEVLAERDALIGYFKANQINGDDSLVRKQWKEKSGYHQRSNVETTMSRIKAHTSCKLTNKTEANRETQSRIKCKLLNIINKA